MFPHHTQSIENVVKYFERDDEVQALLLGGSLAHGFNSAISDVDILIIVADDVYEERQRTGRTLFFNKELCTYPEGYVDGKYLSQRFLDVVKEKGSEPARFAFKDARILLSRIDGLDQKIQAVTQYPIAEKVERMQRFYAQLEAWHWFTSEALSHANQYLLGLAVSKLVLFGGRLILAHNELLYPYHKWFLQVLAQASDKPENLMQQIDTILTQPNKDSIEQFYETVKNFKTWDSSGIFWAAQFQIDSELNWLNGQTPIDDL